MQKLDINITKAEISSFSVELGKDIPTVSATIKLLTDGGKTITTYSIMSNHWEKHLAFDLPLEMIMPIKNIARQLEVIVSEFCQNSVKSIEYVAEVKPEEPESF